MSPARSMRSGMARACSCESALYLFRMLFGAHESVAGGVSSVFARAAIDGCHAIQIFTKNSNQWKEPALAPEVIAAFREARAAFATVARAGDDPGARELPHQPGDGRRDHPRQIDPCDALVAEVERSSALGIDFVVLHPGAHLGAGEEDGPRPRVVRGDRRGARADRQTGDERGSSSRTRRGRGRAWGTGSSTCKRSSKGRRRRPGSGSASTRSTPSPRGTTYPPRRATRKTWAAFGACVGFPPRYARRFHLNDSREAARRIGSNRHEHLGEGMLGLRTFWRLANDKRFAETPAVPRETEPRGGARASSRRW